MNRSVSDGRYRQKTAKKRINRINKLIKETRREPFEGVRKPEPLKHSLAGYWSHRINEEHRMVYARSRRTPC